MHHPVDPELVDEINALIREGKDELVGGNSSALKKLHVVFHKLLCNSYICAFYESSARSLTPRNSNDWTSTINKKGRKGERKDPQSPCFCSAAPAKGPAGLICRQHSNLAKKGINSRDLVAVVGTEWQVYVMMRRHKDLCQFLRFVPFIVSVFFCARDDMKGKGMQYRCHEKGRKSNALTGSLPLIRSLATSTKA